MAMQGPEGMLGTLWPIRHSLEIENSSTKHVVSVSGTECFWHCNVDSSQVEGIHASCGGKSSQEGSYDVVLAVSNSVERGRRGLYAQICLLMYSASICRWRKPKQGQNEATAEAHSR